jgi:hypothetical protein
MPKSRTNCVRTQFAAALCAGSAKMRAAGDHMKLTAAERRTLQAALREFDASRQSDFHTLRECHPFLRQDDDEVDVGALARKPRSRKTGRISVVAA